MTAIQTAKLERLRHYGTSYELALSHPDGRKWLICYCMASGTKIRWALIRPLESGGRRIDQVAKLTGTNADDWKWTANDALACGDWTIKLSGRTQREAISTGELDYIFA